MARSWDSTLYVESHGLPFNLPPKCPECSGLRVLKAHRGAAPSSAPAPAPTPVAATTPIAAPTPIVAAPTPLVSPVLLVSRLPVLVLLVWAPPIDGYRCAGFPPSVAPLEFCLAGFP